MKGYKFHFLVKSLLLTRSTAMVTNQNRIGYFSSYNTLMKTTNATEVDNIEVNVFGKRMKLLETSI